MPKTRNPRRGSMQYWPRKRASSIVSRIRNWPLVKDSKLTGYAAYKVGMTHIMITDGKIERSVPVTILECPPVKIAAVLLYKKDGHTTRCVGQINAEKLDKELSRALRVPKKTKQTDTTNLSDVRVLAYTLPQKTGLGKKTPDVFELGLGGKVDDKLTYAQNILGKEVKFTDVFSQGQFVDTVAITKGKGKQGPVKRFGVMLRHHKSEKTRRGPASLGPWHGHRLWRVALAGQMGFQQRCETNKYIFKYGENPQEVNPDGGFIRYGNLKSPYLLIKGSIQGASKRLVTLVAPRRQTRTLPKTPTINYISTRSKQ